MSRNYELYLNDILKAYAKISAYVADMDEEAFKADGQMVDSVMFNLMIIGEAVKNIPDEFREEAPQVRWRDIARFRDRVVHHYFGIDLEIIWEIVDLHLPVLREAAEKLLQDSQKGADSDDDV